MESHFFQRLVNIPLFQGISRDDFFNIAAKVHFDFHTYRSGETILYADQPCDSLVCIVTGSVSKKMRSDDGRYLFSETIDKSIPLQPERLFGLLPYYSATYTAISETSILRIPKHEVRDYLFNYVTFHINYLNAVCTAKQQWEGRLWRRIPDTLEKRFVHFLLTRADRPAGHKELEIGMIDLSNELLTTRLNVSKMLNELKDADLIYLQRGHIIIPELEKLVLKQVNN